MPRIDYTITALSDAEYTRFAEGYRNEHYPLAADILRFAVTAAEYLQRGYVIGRGTRAIGFSVYESIGLSLPTPTHIPLGRYEMRITPHSHSAEIPEIPNAYLLSRFRDITRDVSVVAAINRVTYWMSWFTVTAYYCYEIAALREKDGAVIILPSRFFASFTRDVHL